MANGRLRCCGSSLFLKKTFGVGYALSIEKGSLAALHPRQAEITENVSDPEHAEAYLPAAMGLRDRDAVLTSIVQDTISDATLLSIAAGEIKFQLPMSASHQFVPVLTRLDDEVTAGNIDSYGLSFTTLEEVFLIASRGVEAKPRQEDEKEGNALTLHGGTALSQEDFERDGLFFRHIQILFLKRWFNFKRDKKAWFFTTILPSLLVFVGFLLFDSLETVAIWFLVVLSFPFITGAFGKCFVPDFLLLKPGWCSHCRFHDRFICCLGEAKQSKASADYCWRVPSCVLAFYFLVGCFELSVYALDHGKL